MDSPRAPGTGPTGLCHSDPSPCRMTWRGWCCWSRCTAPSPSCADIRITADLEITFTAEARRRGARLERMRRAKLRLYTQRTGSRRVKDARMKPTQLRYMHRMLVVD